MISFIIIYRSNTTFTKEEKNSHFRHDGVKNIWYPTLAIERKEVREMLRIAICDDTPLYANELAAQLYEISEDMSI